jgi:hypothetical protein
MNSIIRFTKSNALQVVRLEDYNKLQTDNTRLYFDLDYNTVENKCGFVKYLSTDDPIIMQYRTNYLSVQCSLFKYVDEDTTTETDITSSINTNFSDYGDGRKQHQLSYSPSALDGRYYIKYTFDQDEGKRIATFQTQWFEVASSYDYHLKIEWNNSGDIPTNEDGYIWGDVNQFMWLDSSVSRYIPIKDVTIIETATGKNIPTQSTIGKGRIWEVEPVPPYLVETINIALGKSKFYVNGERYTTEDAIETERLGDLNEYPFEITLRLVEDVQGNGYEDYTEDQELDGEIVPVTDSYLLINDSGDRLLINSTDYLLNSEA